LHIIILCAALNLSSALDFADARCRCVNLTLVCEAT
jgi:hypothetical protein